jgi:predicted ABC-type ATPase
MAEQAPSAIVLAGPNGAGKTTASRTLLADTLRVMTFLNADTIAQGLAGFDPDSAAVEASRIMLERLDRLVEQRQDFAFETTLAARSYAARLRHWSQSGYRVHLVYLWLASADLAVARVALRVQLGGHHVPEATVRQRYQRSVRNFFTLYQSLPITWQVYDNTEIESPRLIVSRDESGSERVLDESVWEKMKEQAS